MDKPMNHHIVVAGSCLLCGNLIDDNSGIFFCRQCRDKLVDEKATEKKEERKTDD